MSVEIEMTPELRRRAEEALLRIVQRSNPGRKVFIRRDETDTAVEDGAAPKGGGA